MSHNITVEGGKAIRLKTSGKYCDRDIVVTSTGGVEDLTESLDRQELLIATLKQALGGNNQPLYKKELKYIECTGTQYIDTGFIPNQDTSVMTEHFYTKNPANRGFIFGAGVSATSRAFEMYTWGNNWNSPYGSNNINISITSSFLIDSKITIDKHKNTVNIKYADGTSQDKTTQYAEFVAPYTMWLFAINRGNTSADLRADCVQLCCCKIWDNNTLVRDFIPVLDMNDRPCLYDKLSRTFFYNAGTGEFLYEEV